MFRQSTLGITLRGDPRNNPLMSVWLACFSLSHSSRPRAVPAGKLNSPQDTTSARRIISVLSAYLSIR
jgi:hypothetical protein